MNYSPSRVLNVGDIQLPDDIEERRKSDRVRDGLRAERRRQLERDPVVAGQLGRLEWRPDGPTTPQPKEIPS